MSLPRASLEQDVIAPHWSDPVAMLIAWLAHIFAQITRLKRVRHTTRFKANWRDHWPNLRQLEWLRDQILADCAARLLAGGTLDDESDFIPSMDPPDDYGGPCPRTPFDMNRRFLAIARFNADPESAILEHVRRIAKREGIDLTNPLAAHGSTDATLRAAAHHEPVGLATITTTPIALILSRPQSGRPSKGERGSAHARGPPTSSHIANHPPRITCGNAPACLTLTFRPISLTHAPTLGAHAHEAVEARLISRAVSTPASVHHVIPHHA